MRVRRGLWAIGDITGKGAFTHMSMYQAAVVIRDVLGQDGPRGDYRAVARVTFTAPEIGSAGHDRATGARRRPRRRNGLYDLAVSTRGWIAKEPGSSSWSPTPTAGCWSARPPSVPSGGEVLSMLATAVHAQVPITTLRTMHFAYPTYHRAVEAALADLGD